MFLNSVCLDLNSLPSLGSAQESLSSQSAPSVSVSTPSEFIRSLGHLSYVPFSDRTGL